MRKIEGKEWQEIRNMGNEYAYDDQEPQKKTKNTCANIITKISIDGRKEHQSKEKNTIKQEEKDTQMTQNIESKYSSLSENIIPMGKGNILALMQNTESAKKNMNKSSSSKIGDAQFVERKREIEQTESYMSIIAMKPELSGDCYALIAISESENSKTILGCLKKQYLI